VAKFAVVVSSPAHSNYTATAISLVKSIIASKHELLGVFFYQDGVLNANSYTAIPSDEFQAHQAWNELSINNQVKLHLCITAAEKRGLSDDKETNNISEQFIVSGLGELVELTNLCDRVVQL